MIPNHYIIKCKICSTVISQCRCMAKDKEVRLAICAECKEKLENPLPESKGG